MPSNRIERAVWRWAALAVGVAAGCGPKLTLPPMPTPKVVVAKPVPREVTNYVDFTGRTDAVSKVEIRARVSGYLDKVQFADGSIVKQKDHLYEIDRRPFKNALDQANAEVKRLGAKCDFLKIEVARYKRLLQSGATTPEDLERYQTQYAEALGSRDAAVAQQAQAQLNYDFSQIDAPISGRIDRTLVTPGNLVSTDATLLTTIVSIDPMFVYVNVDEPTMLRVRKMIRDGVVPARSLKEVEVHMGLADDAARQFPLRGKLDITANTVDAQTGTIQVRGKFDNPYSMPSSPPVLTPGMFVRVRIPLGRPHSTMLVAQTAIGASQGQKHVYVIDAQNKASLRPVKLGMVFDGMQSIEEGLAEGERVVVSGVQRVRPGGAVDLEEVDMETFVRASRPPAKAEKTPPNAAPPAKPADTPKTNTPQTP